jgi:hypothetical protein
VVAVFVIQFRPSETQPPAETRGETRRPESTDAGSVPPTSTQTLADPLDPPAHQLGLDELAEAPGAAAKIRALREKAESGNATEADLRMLRDLCLDYVRLDCALDAHRMLKRMEGQAPSGKFDENAQRRALEAKVWNGTATEAEIRMLRAICSNQGDRACRDRATKMLRQLDNDPD